MTWKQRQPVCRIIPKDYPDAGLVNAITNAGVRKTAKRAGVAATTVSQWINGRIWLPLNTAKAIAATVNWWVSSPEKISYSDDITPVPLEKLRGVFNGKAMQIGTIVKRLGLKTALPLWGTMTEENGFRHTTRGWWVMLKGV